MEDSLKQQLKDVGYNGKFDLSSLIEACGDEFRALRLDSSMKTENNEQWACDRVEHGVFETFIGKTPEEAVARLYLRLNSVKMKECIVKKQKKK